MIGLVGRWGFRSGVGYQGSWKIGIVQLGSGGWTLIFLSGTRSLDI